MNWLHTKRRGTTITDTVIIILALALTLVVCSVLMCNMMEDYRERDAEVTPEPQEVNASSMLDEYDGMTFENVTDAEFYEFTEYVFGTLKRLKGFYDG